MKEMCVGIVLATLSGLAIWGALLVPAASAGETWAGVVPFGAALALLLISLLMIIDSHRRSAIGNVEAPTEASSATIEIIGLFLIALIYQQSMRWFGYVLPTAIVAPIVLYIFGMRDWIALALSIVLCPLAFHIIFFELLGVFPPYGEVFDLLNIIRR